MKPSYSNLLKEAGPDQYYDLLVPEEIFEMIAKQTNLFASQNITARQTKPGSRSHSWKPTNKTEIKQFLGLVLFMGVVKLPKLAYYWSKDKILGQTFPATIMSRNRFELLLQYPHFSDNLSADRNDHIAIIRPLIDVLNATFQKYYSSKEGVCVDESQVPFRGQIIFRQYNKSKRHKYGMKLFKLCTVPGYTCKLNLCSGKNIVSINTTPKNVVMALCENIFDKGHTLATDNWYTSLELAYRLLVKQNLIGTLRKNRRGLPKAVVDSKLQKGETMAMENEDEVTVLKWKDKRDMLMLSTKHSDKIAVVVKKGKQIRKPKVILDYNKSKGSVETSDQMGAYSSSLRKTVKWYKKLAMELLLNMAVVNAWVMYNENKQSKSSRGASLLSKMFQLCPSLIC
ncbi:LOW QUALITY PROTEIN: piggyBac transposable element-derived protein 4-like [Battus philenor]|uniref:LOW QUALITY PROTEIN: piggyBac transposable element-derived protein 4-like n=1 Tax=Battus philenor TaxID=42288 RepID=UPI0035D00C1A